MARPPVRYANTEFLMEVSKGHVDKHSLVHKFGRNAAVPNGTWELVANRSATAFFLSSPTTVRVKAGDAADTAGGTGAREVTIEGLDDNLARVSEAVATAGTSASAATTTAFWRVDRAYVTACGTYGSPFNAAAVVIENSAGTQDLLQIEAGESQTQYCMYSVAAGTKAYLLSVDITVDAAKAADIRLFTRSDLSVTAAPVSAQRLRHYWDGVQGNSIYKPRSPELSVDGACDIWVEARGGGVGTEVTASFELLLVTQ